MQISSYYAAWFTKDAEASVAAHEAVGFKVKHHLKEYDGMDIYVMESSDGSRMDIVSVQAALPHSGARVNVDNLEEAIQVFREQGFEVYGEIHSSKSNRAALLYHDANSATYFVIQHMKG